MAQVFDRGVVLALKLGALITLTALIALLFAWRWSTSYPHAQGAPPGQPLPFSHQHHVRDDGLDCRYCHTSVEKSSFAGIPSSDICMSCHSQLFHDVALFEPLRQSLRSGERLRWTRVNDLPDFVYFDHSAHVNHGVPCKECHGQIDQMPLTVRARSLDMQWCLSCHRDPGAHLVPPAQVFDMRTRPPASAAEQRALLAHYAIANTRWMTACSTCHR
ncbi:MAG: cytochrome c3 family protein [Steroidobacteraceae bacterium]